MLKDQNVPEMREFETGTDYGDRARLPLQVSEEEYSSLPQDCIFTSSPFLQLQKKREHNHNIEEDTTLTEHSLSSPLCQAFMIPIALDHLLITTAGFVIPPSSLGCSQQQNKTGKQNRAG